MLDHSQDNNHGQQVESANSWKQNDLLRLTNPWSWCFEQPAANNLRSAHGGMVNVSQTLQYRTERTRMIGVGESSPNAAGWQVAAAGASLIADAKGWITLVGSRLLRAIVHSRISNPACAAPSTAS